MEQRTAEAPAGATGTAAPPAAPSPTDQEEDQSDEEEDDADESMMGPDSGGRVPFWYMEMHPKVTSEILWECKDGKNGNCSLLVDFTPGPATFAWVALNMGLKAILICHNQAHIDVCKTFLLEKLKKAIDDDDELFTPKNKKQRLNDAKPDALIEFEKQQKKRSGAELKSDAKRATYGSGMDVGFL